MFWVTNDFLLDHMACNHTDILHVLKNNLEFAGDNNALQSFWNILTFSVAA